MPGAVDGVGGAAPPGVVAGAPLGDVEGAEPEGGRWFGRVGCGTPPGEFTGAPGSAPGCVAPGVASDVGSVGSVAGLEGGTWEGVVAPGVPGAGVWPGTVDDGTEPGVVDCWAFATAAGAAKATAASNRVRHGSIGKTPFAGPGRGRFLSDAGEGAG